MGKTAGSKIEPLSIINGDISEKAGIARTKLGLSDCDFNIPLTHCRKVSDLALLPTSSSGSDLALIAGTPGTSPPLISTGNVNGDGAVSRKTVVLWDIPDRYESAADLIITLFAGMLTAEADVSALIDLSAYLLDDEGGTSADLVATAAQDMNSLTASDYAFTVNASNLEAGKQLQLVITLATNDAATVAEVHARLYKILATATCRG